jgi:putative aldouronate transport system substrate-binding protein
VNGFPITQQKVTLRVATPTRTEVLDYVNNDSAMWMEALTNVHVEFVLLPVDGYLDRVNLMIASGEKLPDIFASVMFGSTDQITLGAAGAILPLNDLIERHGYNFKRLMNQHEEVRPSITMYDGNIYSLPHYETNEADRVAYRMWINQKFLDALGRRMPTTTDEFYQYLVAVRDGDPNGNRQRDEVPFMSSRTGWNAGVEAFLMNSFIFDDQSAYGTGARRMSLTPDGKVQVSYNKPEWRQGLEYFYRLGSEGLLDPLSFTQDQNDLRAFVEQSNVPNRLGAVTAGSPSVFSDLNGERRKDFSPVAPLKGPNGVQAAWYDRFRPVMGGRFSISKDCEMPDVAMKWGDSCYTTDWWTRNRFGVLGRDWIIPPAGTEAVDGGSAKYEEILKWNEPQKAFWAYNNFSVSGWASYNRAKSLTDPFEFEYVLWQHRNLHWPHRVMNGVPSALPYSVEEAREVNRLVPLLGARVNTFFAEVATGRLQPNDANWNAYVAELDRMGLPQLLQLVQTAFDRNWAAALGYKK